jgi:hypothetical protein
MLSRLSRLSNQRVAWSVLSIAHNCAAFYCLKARKLSLRAVKRFDLV